MRKKSKIIRNLLFFVLLIVITFYILLKDQDVTQIFSIIGSANPIYWIIGIVCMLLYIVCEAINIGRTLKALNEKSSFYNNFKYALIGFFFSAITPAASGGQPMQIYYMYKDKISVSNSTLALLMNLSAMQIITISFAFISLCFNYNYMNKVLIIFFIVGIALNMSALALLIVGIFSKRMSKGLINIALKVMKFFRIKNLEAKKEKLEGELVKYQESAVYIKNNKKIMLKVIGTTAIQILLYYSISYWTYRALGLSKNNIFEIITMQAVLFATVSGIPSPGAVGVSEGVFMELFRNIYPEAMMGSAVLLNRGINFYLFVLISAIVVIINHLKWKDVEEEDFEHTKTTEDTK